MKSILIIFSVLLVSSCSSESNSKKDSSNPDFHSNIEQGSEYHHLYENKTLIPIDSEELCEFNFEYFIPKINEVLKKENIRLNVSKTKDYESSFEIMLNEKNFKLYAKQELLNNSFWETGPSNFFTAVNTLLIENGSKKLFYLLYGGNDLHAILLSKEDFFKYFKQELSELKRDPIFTLKIMIKLFLCRHD